MKVKDAAAIMEVSPAVVYQLIAAGKLRHYRVGKGRGVIRLADEHVREYLDGASRGGPAAPAPPARSSRPLNLKHLRVRT